MPPFQQLLVNPWGDKIHFLHGFHGYSACQHRVQCDGVIFIIFSHNGFQTSHITRAKNTHDALIPIQSDAIQLDHALPNTIDKGAIITLAKKGRTRRILNIFYRQRDMTELFIRHIRTQGTVSYTATMAAREVQQAGFDIANFHKPLP